MRFAVEATGRIWSRDEELDRAAIGAVYDRVADSLADLHALEADVAANLDTSHMEFYIVVEAADSREAFAMANELIDRAMTAAEVTVEWKEGHARRADLVPA